MKRVIWVLLILLLVSNFLVSADLNSSSSGVTKPDAKYELKIGNKIYKMYFPDDVALTIVEPKDSSNHQVSISGSGNVLKIRDYINTEKTYFSTFAYGVDLSYRFNMFGKLYLGLSATYNNYVEKSIAPDVYVNTNSLPVVAQLGLNKTLNDLNVFTSLGFGYSFLSDNNFLAQAEIGASYYIKQDLALTAKTNLNVMYDTHELGNQLDSLTYIITPLNLGLTIGL